MTRDDVVNFFDNNQMFDLIKFMVEHEMGSEAFNTYYPSGKQRFLDAMIMEGYDLGINSYGGKLGNELMTAYPFTPSDAEEQNKEESITMLMLLKILADGFATENLPTMAIDYLMNKQDFPEDETYNPKEDPQLKKLYRFL